MLTLITTYKKPLLWLILITTFTLSGVWFGYTISNNKFTAYKLEQDKKHNQEVAELMAKQKEQSIKDTNLVNELNDKISGLEDLSQQRKDKLSQLLKQNQSIKECKLDSQSLIELNNSITNKQKD